MAIADGGVKTPREWRASSCTTRRRTLLLPACKGSSPALCGKQRLGNSHPSRGRDARTRRWRAAGK
jgi:hypothetical protein